MAIKAFLTKPPVMDVICGGIDRCTVWLFHPPTYQPLNLECPVFGEITDPNEIAMGHWRGEDRYSFSGKVIRKAGGELLESTWKSISDTYYAESGLDMINEHRNVSDDFFKRAFLFPQPKAHSKRHASYTESQAHEDFISFHMEKRGMRHSEWILPLDLNITLIT